MYGQADRIVNNYLSIGSAIMRTMTTDTRETIMAAARAMVQAHGYNALSFRELAKAVGVKSASVHYHFPTKGDLAAALARRYTEDAAAYLDHVLASSPEPATCMRAYTAIFRAALEAGNRMCLCGIMAAEHDDLPAEVRAEVNAFTALNVRWLGQVLALGKTNPDRTVLQDQAIAIYSAIEGAQLISRGRGDIAVYDAIVATYRRLGLSLSLSDGRATHARGAPSRPAPPPTTTRSRAPARR
jgi:TetR/AcrR family transcriptional repressor of nem operon